MPKKTLALISGLVLVTVVLFVVAIKTNNQSTMQPQPTQPPAAAQPMSVAHSVLSMSPNPITVAPGQSGTVDVTINTSDNPVTAVQLEIAYDPNVITNVKVTPGQLFPNPAVLVNKNNPTTGRYTFAYGIGPRTNPVQGTGQAAVITFTAKNVAGKQAQLALLPTSLVTARGVAPSVLKSATGTLVVVGGTTGQ